MPDPARGSSLEIQKTKQTLPGATFRLAKNWSREGTEESGWMLVTDAPDTLLLLLKISSVALHMELNVMFLPISK